MSPDELKDFDKKRAITWPDDCISLCKQASELYATRGRPIRFDVLNDVEKQDIENTMKRLYPAVPFHFTLSDEMPEEAY
jgi:hypothetical protein